MKKKTRLALITINLYYNTNISKQNNLITIKSVYL
jgi:hypothetical protein